MAAGGVLQRTERVGVKAGEGEVQLAGEPPVFGDEPLHRALAAHVRLAAGRPFGDELEREEVDAALVADRRALGDGLHVRHADEHRAGIHARELSVRRTLDLDDDVTVAIQLLARRDGGSASAVRVVGEAHARARAGLDGDVPTVPDNVPDRLRRQRHPDLRSGGVLGRRVLRREADATQGPGTPGLPGAVVGRHAASGGV